MFKGLFIKECKEILRSITYYLFVVYMVLFFITQMGEFEVVSKPRIGMDEYGMKYSEDKSMIMDSTLELLEGEYQSNEYVTYPIGFYKSVRLNDKKQKNVSEIIGKIKGNNNITFETFSAYMDEIDNILGGGSYYSTKVMYRNAKVPKTYGDALTEYNDILYKDRVSGAYARIFSDYMGIVLGMLPVFLAVTRVLKDRRANAEEVIFSKKASSTVIILSRYLSIITMILIPLILISIMPTIQSLYLANSNGVQGDMFAFLKYIIGWLLPTALVSTSVGFFLTELTSGVIAILIQGLWWFISMFMGASVLVGNVGLNLIPRFNTIGDFQIYKSIFNELVFNRIIYILVAILLIVATIRVYDMKRKGTLIINGKIFSNGKGKLEV